MSWVPFFCTNPGCCIYKYKKNINNKWKNFSIFLHLIQGLVVNMLTFNKYINAIKKLNLNAQLVHFPLVEVTR